MSVSSLCVGDKSDGGWPRFFVVSLFFFQSKQVLCVRRFEEESEAVEAANRSEFGLAASVMSSDQERWVNTDTCSLLRSNLDPFLKFVLHAFRPTRCSNTGVPIAHSQHAKSPFLPHLATNPTQRIHPLPPNAQATFSRLSPRQNITPPFCCSSRFSLSAAREFPERCGPELSGKTVASAPPWRPRGEASRRAGSVDASWGDGAWTSSWA